MTASSAATEEVHADVKEIVPFVVNLCILLIPVFFCFIKIDDNSPLAKHSDLSLNWTNCKMHTNAMP